MSDLIYAQAVLFLQSLGYGLFLGVCWDVLRALRRCVAHRTAAVHMEDGLFCLGASAGLFFLLQCHNGGRLRFFILLGAAAGFLLCFFFVSRFFLPLFTRFLANVLCAAGLAAGIVLLPIKIIVKSLLNALKKQRRTIRIIRSRK